MPETTPASGRDTAVLVHRGQLLAVLDLRVPPAADPTPVSPDVAAVLAPLTSTGGVLVSDLTWWSTAGDLPRTVVVLTLDPVANRHAIDARGAGAVGVGRVVAVTVARAAALLAPYGLRPRLLGPVEAMRILTADRRQPAASV